MQLLIGNKNYEYRIYNKNNAITFAKVHEPFGGLHNMAPNFPINLNDLVIRTSEHLYQAMRFPNHPEIQNKVLAPPSPMASKQVMKEHIQYSREDWDNVKISIMKWSLMMKLLNNFESFSELLLSTNGKELVEYSKKDPFWGASYQANQLTGVNALGRLLMGIREDLPNIDPKNYILKPPSVDNFNFLGNKIEEIHFN